MTDSVLGQSDAGLFTLRQVQLAVDAMVREDDYSPEDAQRRIAVLLEAERNA